ncbi:hypothetical protein [Amycolatopsis sulphurea]|uniref:hypothetical protein n=1 Tax=Amycolatopsis sulphurea TaxID=76022 RepID=UPI001B803684|nr:hypothetical protein [Amycolatopsis sulphurea]
MEEVPFDLAPIEAPGALAYVARICGPATEIDAGAFTLPPPYGPAELADTVIVPGRSVAR